MTFVDETGDMLASRFAHYSKNSSQFRKAIDAALAGCVKRHLFLPSERSIYSVVGRNGDEFLDPDKPFCSCKSYFYRVLGGKAEYCYHILSYKIAADSGLIREIRFDDDEYDHFSELLLRDVMRDA